LAGKIPILIFYNYIFIGGNMPQKRWFEEDAQLKNLTLGQIEQINIRKKRKVLSAPKTPVVNQSPLTLLEPESKKFSEELNKLKFR